MAFRIRDLMVNVMAQGGGGGQAIVCGDSRIHCIDGSYGYGVGGFDITNYDPTNPNCWQSFGTIDPCGITCNTTGPTCGQFSCVNYTCPPVTHRYLCGNPASAVAVTPVNNWRAFASRDLATLKEQLRTALAEVEAREKAAEEASLPRTREEAEDLETKLKEALEEVRGWKKTLPSGGSK